MKYLLTLSLILSTLSVSAQVILPPDIVQPNITNPENVQEQSVTERPNPLFHVDSTIVVNAIVNRFERGDARVIVEQNLIVEPKSIEGYRIVIFMKNSQTARDEAIIVEKDFHELYPEEQAYLTYENPYFKVSAGNCTTPEEAAELMGRLRSSYPKAFIVRANIDIKEFAK